uniref:Uncharacterized protein n=1 Tax=Cannabis sativa TaxID=3483 RepID=A0A803R9F7_CANSA
MLIPSCRTGRSSLCTFDQASYDTLLRNHRDHNMRDHNIEHLNIWDMALKMKANDLKIKVKELKMTHKFIVHIMSLSVDHEIVLYIISFYF